MKKVNKERRFFLKVSAAAGGGMMIGFPWFMGCKADSGVSVIPSLPTPDQWFDISGFIKIGDTGLVTIMSPNPEIGQNIKTSMPMIVAEELEVDWKDVVVEQAPLNKDVFTRQVAGGSQSIRKGWVGLRTAGATAKEMLLQAAANELDVNVSSLKAANGIISHADGRKLSYGKLASKAAQLEVPVDVKLKEVSDFKIIGTSKENVDLHDIVTGKPLFGIDYKKEGMVYAVVKRPDSFGQKISSVDDSKTRMVKGVVDVVQFGDKVAVIADKTWAAIKGQKMLKVSYESAGKLESSELHKEKLVLSLSKDSKEPKRNDGDVIAAFKEADEILDKTYTAPFLPHNPLEPMNFFAEVTDTKVELVGPIQTPEWTQGRVADLLKRDASEVSIMLTRMGGGFGRRLYGNFALEAAEVSDKIRKPVLLVYTREDDFGSGPYRPASGYRIKAAIKDGEVTGYHLIGAGFNMGNATRENWFPSGTIKNLRIDSHNIETNIPTGAWRAPVTNFLASAEQSFFDELAEKLEKDPIDLRLELLKNAKNNLIGEIDYDLDKMIGVIELARLKSGWGNKSNQGFSVYYSHNTYVAEVAEVELTDDLPKVTKVTCAVDCGIVINPIGAINQIQGGIIDGIGHAMFGDLVFNNGQPVQKNFNQYRMIKMSESPEIDVHFVESNNDPTGLGEPTLPPAGGAVANAFFKASGKRLYNQPYAKEMEMPG